MFSPYLLDSWIATSLAALACGCAGFFVVLRRASFAAHALPMAAFPGAAAAALFGFAPVWGLIAGAVAGVLLLLRLKRGQRGDTATALALATLLALGALFLSLSGRYAESVYALLFGQVFGIGPADLPGSLLLGLAVPLALLTLARPLLLGALSPDLAFARGAGNLAFTRGARAGLAEALFLFILAFAAVLALPVTGALLVFSLMTGPAGAACRLAATPRTALILSVLFALALVWAALAGAYLTGWPPGFFTGMGAALIYAAARMRRKSRPAPRSPAPG